MGARRQPVRATAVDLEAYDDGYEVVDGCIVQKALPTAWKHSRCQARCYGILIPFDEPCGRGRPGGWVFGTETTVELERDQVYVPDLAGWHIERAPALDVGIVQVPPDWVCEILSPSTAERDRGSKMAGYHRAKVGHYWIIDPDRRELLVHRRVEHEYRLVLTAGPMDRVRAEPFDAIELDLGELFLL